MEENKINIFDLTYTELGKTLKAEGLPAFRATQLCDWLYKKLVFDTSLMLNIPKSCKDIIQEKFDLYIPKIHYVSHSASDNSYKFLFKTRDDKLIEAILMLENGRSTVCVSCMIGCPLKCVFCATGSQIGFIRKLTTAEITGQVLAILCYAKEHEYTQKISNIVFMGMGEPLLNRKSVEGAIDILTHPKCFALSPSKISVSTAGVPGIADFIRKTGVRIAVSLHFTHNELRSEYMPINQRFSIEQLMAELKKIKLKKRDYILIEYLMLKDINDSIGQAKQLLRLIGNLKVKVNLIPYNPTETLPAEASDEETINNFAAFLQNKGIFTSVRRSKGVDVEGGCGQFALKKQ